MAPFLSAEWLAERRDPAAAVLEEVGTDLRLQYVVTGGPDGDARFGTIWVAGAPAELVVGDVADPDVTLTLTAAEALAVVRGDLDLNVAYMRGSMKVAGHTGLLLDFLAACRGARYEAVRSELAAATS